MCHCVSDVVKIRIMFVLLALINDQSMGMLYKTY